MHACMKCMNACMYVMYVCMHAACFMEIPVDMLMMFHLFYLHDHSHLFVNIDDVLSHQH